MPRKKAVYDVIKDERGTRFYVARLLELMYSVPPIGDPSRTKVLQDFASKEPLLAGALYTVITRNTNYRPRIIGKEEDVRLAWEILEHRTWFGAGWHQFVAGISWAFLTSDNGAWIEIVRPARIKGTDTRLIHHDGSYFTPEGQMVSPEDVEIIPAALPEQIIPLDPTRCFPTGDPITPLRYERADGTIVSLQWWQCAGLVDQPIPGRTYGLCAVSRVVEAAKFVWGVVQYNNERVYGNTSREIVLTNVSAAVIEKAMNSARERAALAGSNIYVPTVFVSTIDPTARPEAIRVSMASLPEGFSLRDYLNSYIILISLATGVYYAFFAPLPGSRLGTATEAEVMARMSRAKSGGYFTGMLAHILNTRGILPRGVTVNFSSPDYTEEKEAAEAALLRAKERAVRISSGEITPEIARQLASDTGDLPVMYLQSFGEQDILPQERQNGVS